MLKLKFSVKRNIKLEGDLLHALNATGKCTHREKEEKECRMCLVFISSYSTI